MSVKGKKDTYNILNILWKFGENNPRLFFKMFDSQIKPMLTYGSEIWGLSADHTVLERVHSFAIKRLLNVSIKTPTKMIYCESGRYPLYIITYTNSIKYWIKITRLQENRIPLKAYKTLYDLHCRNKTNWVSRICFALYRYGFGFVWENQGVENVNAFLLTFRQRLLDCYLQDLEYTLNTHERYSMYSTFMHLWEPPQYIHLIKNSFLRKFLTRMRLGVSQLKPHRFRFSVVHNDLSCVFCPGVEESELHFILVCPAYQSLREQFIPSNYYQHPNALNLTLLLTDTKTCSSMSLFYVKHSLKETNQ